MTSSETPPTVNNQPFSLGTTGETIPMHEALSDAEQHDKHHIHIFWHADALIEGKIYHGFVKDISIEGAELFLEHHFSKTKLIKLHIYVPPYTRSEPRHLLDISGKVLYTGYDGDEFLFRSNIKFLKFNLESDAEYLQFCIANH